MNKEYHKNKENPTIGKPLTDDDLRNLSDCFITPDIAELAGLSRVTDEEGAAILNRHRNASSDYAGLAIPYKNPKTEQVIEYEIRRDVPGTETKNGRTKEVGKYLRPVGSRSLAYFVPRTNPEHFKDTLVTMIVTEGAKKALAIENALTDNLSKPLHFLIVGFSGVDNFKTSQTEIKNTGEKRQVKDVLPELKEIDFQGREVLIIRCSDKVKK